MPPSSQKQPKILIVDDQEIIRFTIGEILVNQGYRTLEAGDVPQGAQVLGTQRPDLVLLDLTMPGEDGMSLLRQMRQSPTFRKTPVIILTGHSDRNFVMEALMLGVKDYVVKPSMVVVDLLERIRSRLEENGITPPSRSEQDPAPGKKGTELDLGTFLTSLEGGRGGRTFAPRKRQLLNTSSGATTSVAEISRELRDDPILAWKVLSLSHLDAPGRSLEIEDAVQVLGIKTLHETLQTTLVHESSEATDLLRDVTALHRRSVFRSRTLELSSVEGNPGGLSGLLLDLPLLLLLGWIRPEDWTSIREASRSGGISIAALLEERFGIPYPEFVSATLSSAKLPSPLLDTIRDHAQAFYGEIPTSIPKPLMILDIANQWANVLVSPERGLDPLQIHSKDELAVASLGLSIAELRQITDQSEVAILRHAPMPLETSSLQLSTSRPRLAVRRESWVGADFPALHLLGQIGEIVSPEQITKGEWDIFVYIGNHPGKLWPMAFPYAKPLVVLHRLSGEHCDFPGSRSSINRRLPCPAQGIVSLFADLIAKKI